MKLLKSLAIGLLVSVSTAASAQVAIIVNPANANALSDNDISRAFLGKLKTYADGQTIEAVNSKANSDARVEFEKLVLKKSPSQVKAYWSKRLFTGKGKPLKELSSDAEVLNHVASTPNAIGYVDASAVNDTIKVIKTL
ncbi:phosphate ABC transporter substrate-binding protein [Thalassotalea euphylliae]|uniref:Phosphate ABC transporter substrate-binding protein n=1 Tax=Thalassotalea euphylliae TaxID=1655234 RepID=A0A3E0TLL7_9GAMM|nr:substrate-binding domain-containing protein [Thalassotalea euphylliae]REL25444.1 phosphate ABC transporter substrate-binding protein [Thalassotalea euphylliae]